MNIEITSENLFTPAYKIKMFSGIAAGSRRPAPEGLGHGNWTPALRKLRAWEQRQMAGDRGPAQRPEYQRAGQCERV